MKKLKYLLILCLFTFGLTGCVKYNVNMTVTKDKKMAYEIIYAENPNYFGQNTMISQALVNELSAKGFSVRQVSDGTMQGILIGAYIDNINKVSAKDVENYSLSTALQTSITEQKIFKVKKGLFKNKYIANFVFDTKDSGYDIPEEFLKDSDDTTNTEAQQTTEGQAANPQIEANPNAQVEGQNPSAEQTQPLSDEELQFYREMVKSMDFNFSITLPYKTKKHNATEVSSDSKTLSWTLKPGEENTIEFEFELYNKVAIYLTIALAIILILIIISIIRTRIRKKKELAEKRAKELARMNEPPLNYFFKSDEMRQQMAMQQQMMAMQQGQPPMPGMESPMPPMPGMESPMPPMPPMPGSEQDGNFQPMPTPDFNQPMQPDLGQQNADMSQMDFNQPMPTPDFNQPMQPDFGQQNVDMSQMDFNQPMQPDFSQQNVDMSQMDFNQPMQPNFGQQNSNLNDQSNTETKNDDDIINF